MPVKSFVPGHRDSDVLHVVKVEGGALARVLEGLRRKGLVMTVQETEKKFI